MSSVYFPVSQGYSDIEPTTTTPPVGVQPTGKTALQKIPYSAGAYLFGASDTRRVTVAKIECPSSFTHARVFLYNSAVCSDIQVAVAPTGRGEIDTIDGSYKPVINGAVDNSAWQTGTLPDIPLEDVENRHGSGPDYLRATESQWFEVESIQAEDGKHYILVRLSVGVGEVNLIGVTPFESGNSQIKKYLSQESEDSHFKLWAGTVLSGGAELVTDYNTVPSSPMTGGYSHVFAVEFAIPEQDTVSVAQLGDSISADAFMEPTKGFNSFGLVSINNAILKNNKKPFFANFAMSAKNEGFVVADAVENGWGYGNHLDEHLNKGVTFDYVICPAFTPNGGALDSTTNDGVPREEEQKRWLDWLVSRTQSLGIKLILWEGIPSQSLSELLDGRRKSINDYASSLAYANNDVYYINIGSQVDTREIPNRHLPEFSADTLHLKKIANNSIAQYLENKLDEIIFNNATAQPTITITQTPPVANVGDTVTLTAQATDANTIVWNGSGIDIVNRVGNEIQAEVTSAIYTVDAQARGAGGEVTTQYSNADTTAPVITLTPSTTTYNLTVGDAIPSITASTDDGSAVTFTDDVQSVNRTVRTYTSTDASGNSSSVIVTFNFADVVAPLPTLTLVATPTSAQGGETVTVTATSNVTNVVFTSTVALSGTGLTRTFTAPSSTTASTVTVTAVATNADGVEVSESVSVNVAADIVVTAPVITLSPSNTNYTINKGDSFILPVATLTDYLGNQTAISPTSNNLDAETAGNYVIQWTGEANGLSATPVSINIQVDELLSSESFNALSRAIFEIDGSTNFIRYAGRSNVETIRFKIKNTSTDIVDKNGYLDFDSNNIAKVEVIINNDVSISSDTQDVQFKDENLYVKFGNINGVGAPSITIVIYVVGDSNGIVIAGAGMRSAPILRMM